MSEKALKVIRAHYGVPAYVGRRVERTDMVDGRKQGGTIVGTSSSGSYLSVWFDFEPMARNAVHPTADLRYLDDPNEAALLDWMRAMGEAIPRSQLGGHDLVTAERLVEQGKVRRVGKKVQGKSAPGADERQRTYTRIVTAYEIAPANEAAHK